MQSCFHQLLSRFGHLDSRIAHEPQHSVVEFSGTSQIAGCQRNMIDTAAGHSTPPKKVPTARLPVTDHVRRLTDRPQAPGLLENTDDKINSKNARPKAHRLLIVLHFQYAWRASRVSQ